ncbi:hypothetical protein ACFLZV_05575 [Candidatus Margulisiibacteriota bacterium]
MIYILLLSVILLRTVTDICFKFAVDPVDFTVVSSVFTNFKKIFLDKYIWLGLLFGVLNIVIWWLSLLKFDLSYAYPFLSISYIAIIFSGKLFFKEHLCRHKIIGIIFICMGAILLFMG